MKQKAEKILRILDKRSVNYYIDKDNRVILSNDNKDEQIENYQNDISNNSALEKAILELIAESSVEPKEESVQQLEILDLNLEPKGEPDGLTLQVTATQGKEQTVQGGLNSQLEIPDLKPEPNDFRFKGELIIQDETEPVKGLSIHAIRLYHIIAQWCYFAPDSWIDFDLICEHVKTDNKGAMRVILNELVSAGCLVSPLKRTCPPSTYVIMNRVCNSADKFRRNVNAVNFVQMRLNITGCHSA